MSEGEFPPSLNFEAGKTYLVKFTEEIREIVKGRKHFYLAVVIYNKKQHTAWFSHMVLRKKLRALEPLEGKTVKITNKGKPAGKDYYDYDVEEVKKGD
ncbi:MAG: hypothetical protein QW334_00360 [Thermofilum sp.]